MGLFDDVVGALLKGQQQAPGQGQGGLSNILGNVLQSVGGYQGVLDMLQKSGLGDRVNSWLSTNASNLPVSPEEIKQALGNQQLQQLAARYGIPLDQIADVLSQYLPSAVDQASPNGTLETPGGTQQTPSGTQ